MGCYANSRRMDELRRCGCSRCREEYYQLERDNYYQSRNYYRPHIDDYKMPLIYTEPKEETKVETKIEEPKNYAVKKLVDELKQQQNSLTSTKAAIDSSKGMRKTYDEEIKKKNKTKSEIETKIKELSVALRKLGHKE